jgi:hypothetical protein
MSNHENVMKPWHGFAATILCWTLAGTAPAAAGYWNYGCKGGLGDSVLSFDRNTFLIIPRAFAIGDIAGLAKSEIFAFDADDNNSGFMTTMKFARGAYPDQRIVLTEKSSKKISERRGNVGTREKTTTTFTKTYHYERLGRTDKPEADIVMQCIEYQLTAP